MNEKFLFNGKHKVPCKWKIFIATCNEIPKEEMGSPFWDRFILKTQVNRISAGDLVKYFDKGGKDYKDSMTIGVPTKSEMDTTIVPTPKLEKYLDIAYNKSSDRTLTFVPNLTRAVSFVWDVSVDKALVKVASIMIDSQAASELQNKLMNPEIKALMSKVDMLWSINEAAGIELAMTEIEGLLSGYAAQGKIDESQVEEIETSIQYILSNHPVKQKGDEIEDILEGVLEEQNIADMPF